ncbi:cytochrome c oxidase subunit II [Patulibacter sp. S7RM1-6]
MGGPATTRDAFDGLAWVYGPVALAVYALVALALLWVGLRYRAGRRAEPSTTLARPRLEAAYALLLAVVAGLLLWRTYDATDRMDAVAAIPTDDAPPALTVEVVASRWNWRFLYPGGVVQTGDGRGHPATLVVPADRPVRFRLTSRDVAHAFWIPELRTKYDALPGRTNAFGLRFPSGLRISDARCSEFCGEFHDQMVFRVDVRPPDAFAAWLRGRREAAR